MKKQIQVKSLFVVWAICLVAGLTSCMQYDQAKPLGWQYKDKESSGEAEWAIRKGETWKADGNYKNFILKGEALTVPKAEATLLFHSDGTSGYEMLFRNGGIDGSRKSGSLSAVRWLQITNGSILRWLSGRKISLLKLTE